MHDVVIPQSEHDLLEEGVPASSGEMIVYAAPSSDRSVPRPDILVASDIYVCSWNWTESAFDDGVAYTAFRFLGLETLDGEYRVVETGVQYDPTIAPLPKSKASANPTKEQQRMKMTWREKRAYDLKAFFKNSKPKSNCNPAVIKPGKKGLPKGRSKPPKNSGSSIV